MNEDYLYLEILWREYYDLKDKSGYYKINFYNHIHYLKNGQLHRLNGPAIKNLSEKYIGDLFPPEGYYIDNKYYTKEEFDQHPDVIQYRLRKFQEYLNE